MIKSGIEALRAIQMANVASDVVYRRLGGDALSVKAVVGRSVFRSTDVDGIWTRIETRDFIVGKGQIGCEPQVVPAACRRLRPIGKQPARAKARASDEIEFLGNTYEVLSPNGEPAWRWSDAFHTAYRIHAKHTGG